MRCSILPSAILVAVFVAFPAQAEEPAKRQSLAEQLTKPVTFSYNATPLKFVIEDLKDKLKVPCVLDVKTLEEAAISIECPVSGKSGGNSALEDINELLRPSRLMAEVRYDVLYVSTWDRQLRLLVARFYRLRQVGDPTNLIKQITTQTAVETWRNAGGGASIAPIGTGMVVISQAPATHRDIERKYAKELLAVAAPTERIAALAPTKGPNPIGKLLDALRSSASAEYPETPLADMVGDFARHNKVKLVLDTESIKQARISLETPVTVNLRHVPLESVLTLVLRDVNLTWTIDGEQLLITTPEVATKRLITIDYEARDLAPANDSDSIIKALTSTVQPSSWEGVGGPGKITAADGALHIAQSVQVHRTIETWLADLRQAMQPTRTEK